MLLEGFDDSSSGNENIPKATDDEDFVFYIVYDSHHLKAELKHENNKASSDVMSSEWDKILSKWWSQEKRTGEEIS